MSNMVIIKPLTISAVASNNGTPSNLLTPDPKEVFAFTGGAGQTTIDIDLGSSQSIDSFFLGFITPVGSAPTVGEIQGGTAAYTTSSYATTIAPAVSSVASPPRRHFFTRLAAPVTARYIRYSINVVNGTAYTIGIAQIGLAFQPTYNKEWGSGRQVIDTGGKESLLGGGFGINEGARKAGHRWTLGDLTDAETEALYDVALDRGETRPLLVVEDPAVTTGLNERIHYGLFDRLEPYERANPSQTRWGLSISQWV